MGPHACGPGAEVGVGLGAQPRVSAEHPVLALAGAAGALGKHKELRSWTLAGQWGDAAPRFVWLVYGDGEVGSCVCI